VIDWDGNQANDQWVDAASIALGPTVYYGNSPAVRLYETTCVRGDMRNQAPPDGGDPDPSDIDPFIEALTDPAGYAADFPGLGGPSMVYHGDCNCDGALNPFDIDPFILRLTNPAAWHNTPGYFETCPGQFDGGGGGAYTPADVAALFVNYVQPGRLPALRAAILEMIDGSGDTPRAEFWREVLALLEG
jgi:hypothetical protein